MLFVIYALNFLDRQVINIVAESIKEDLQLRDWQLGAMTGLAFAIFYTLLGLPIARLAERADRPLIISASIAVWSGFTVACGFASTFVQFALCRVGVGAGEAGCTPTAHSLISDYAPKEKRASALAFYSAGGSIGGILGMAVGGVVADAWGWRSAFFVAGAPGVIIGLIAALSLAEPRRRLKRIATQVPAPRFAATLRDLFASRTYRLFTAAGVMMALVSYGHAAFSTSFFLRNHMAGLQALSAPLGLQPLGFFGIVTGLISGIGGLSGALVGGWLADRMVRKGPEGYARLAAIGALFSVPPYLAAVLVGSTPLALACLFPAAFAFNLILGPMYAVPQSIVAPHSRATATAVFLFMTNLFGLGLGPLSMGVLSDTLQDHAGMTGGQSIQVAQVLATLLGLVAAWCYWTSRHTIAKEIIS
ncbi:MAG: MFS transporter [Phenylobacterium sp.]